MKKKLSLALSFMMGAVLLAACGSSSSSSSSSSSVAGSSSAPASSSSTQPTGIQETVYRGEVLSVDETTGDFEVAQLPGFNYGNESIVFHVTEETDFEPEEAKLEKGMFVEVTFNGITTRSMPPQATADDVEVISNFSEGIIVNGTVQSVDKVDDNLMVTVLPLDAQQAASGSLLENAIVLTVEPDDLEGLTVDDLVEGTKISAVTRGIATMSLPPQMPTVALMPYTWES